MDKIARLSAADRRDLFSDAAAQLGIRPTIVEKDFWVCLVLRILFTDSPFRNSLVFKGGTSLSKVYGLIQRFSEDIDLVLDWRHLGLDADDVRRDHASNTQQDRFNKRINQLAVDFTEKRLRPGLEAAFRRTGIELSTTAADDDPQVVNVRYPAAFSEAYIRPEIRLEIGPFASWVPSTRHLIRPYAFDVLPGLFENPDSEILTIFAERTFWEKATILHQEAHRPGPILGRHSRHYYDLFMLAKSPAREAALADLKLLRDVVDFKSRFYPSKWARYDLANPGSFRLLPASVERLHDLARDYAAMQVMFFREPPPFDSIVEGLRELEQTINERRRLGD